MQSSYLPNPFTLHRRRWNLEQAIGTPPADNLFDRTSWASNLVAILTPEQVV